MDEGAYDGCWLFRLEMMDMMYGDELWRWMLIDDDWWVMMCDEVGWCIMVYDDVLWLSLDFVIFGIVHEDVQEKLLHTSHINILSANILSLFWSISFKVHVKSAFFRYSLSSGLFRIFAQNSPPCQHQYYLLHHHLLNWIHPIQLLLI